jgi:GH24 family phage-related lysozyme (muramidase)
MDRKHIFDAVRRLLGRGFRQAEVEALDAAIDSALRPDSPDPVEQPRAVSAAGIALIMRFEGCARQRPDGLVEAYPDPGTGGAPWTIGWGATGPGIGPGTTWTPAHCDERLVEDLARHAAEVTQAIGNAPTTQAQFDALVSFHYNTGAIGRATLTRRHVAGDHAGAAREFGRWVLAGGRTLPGLVRRRAAEAALYRAK